MPATVLRPVSAATLYLQHKAVEEAGPLARPENLVTGCKAIDEQALEGGLRYGVDSLVGLACEGNQPHDLATAISLSFLSTHLLPSLPESSCSLTPPPPAVGLEPPPPRPPQPSTGPTAARPSLAFYIHPPSHPFPAIQLHAALLARLRHLRRAPAARAPFTHDGGYVYKRSGFGRFNDLVARMKEEKAEWQAGAEARWREVDGRMRGRDEQAVRRCMERVSVMGCFDVEGVLEGVGEVRQRMEGTFERAAGAAQGIDEMRGDRPPPDEGRGGDGGIVGGAPREIADSQASLMDGDEDEEMPDWLAPPEGSSLFGPSVLAADDAAAKVQHATAAAGVAGAASPPTAPHPPPPQRQQQQRQQQPQDQPHHRHLLLIPQLPSFVSPAMHKNHTRAHALLVHLCRTLRALSSVQPLISILGNGTVGRGLTLSTLPSSSVSSSHHQHHQDRRSRDRDRGPDDNNEVSFPADRHHGGGKRRRRENYRGDHDSSDENKGVSAFAAAGSLRPALGQTLAHLLDVSLLVSAAAAGAKSPSSSSTGREGDGDDGGKQHQQQHQQQHQSRTGEARRRRKRRKQYVLEVIKDRCGPRVGSWGAFSVKEEGDDNDDDDEGEDEDQGRRGRVLGRAGMAVGLE